MSVVRLLDHDVTPVDMIAKFLQPLRFVQNELVDRFRLIDSPIGDIYW